ncbi:latent-transforming growth factor beta-binding protein 3, partial [Oncorhynchus kisutch]|uniref:latent-transforming growth factor beta-binding protein 3 n=1 Tax=Oncorhynchus kisutch TaxID=8019 RepID=UPI0012DD86E9
SGCPSPGDLLQGVTSVTEDGSWALFSCDAGYRLYGHSLLYCKGQNWNGTKPVCKESDDVSWSSSVPLPPRSLMMSPESDMMSPGPPLCLSLLESDDVCWSSSVPVPPRSLMVSPGIDPPLCLSPPRSLMVSPESDMMSSWKQKEPTVPMPRIQSQNLAVLSALKNHLQLHYNTIANTASKPVSLANAPPKDPHTHLKDPHSIDRSPKAHHVEENLKDTRDLTDREGAPEKPTRPQASTSSSATTETITSTSSLPVAEGKAGADRATQLEPGQGVTEPADVSSTDTQEPRPQKPTETSSTSFINSSNTTSHWVNGTDTYGHHIQVKETASLSDDDDDDGVETHRRNVTSPDLASNGSSQDNETDTSDSHHSQANETSSSPLSGDGGETSRHNGTSSYPSVNRSDQHLIKGATNTEKLPRPVTLNRRPLCPYPPLPAHGTFYFRTVDNPGPRDYKHYIQYACYAGYTLAHGDIHSYCLQAGRWSGLTPVCLEVTPCALNNGGCSQLCSVNQEQAQCHCRPGFILLEDHRTCRDVDECVEGQQQQRCQQTCVNTFGSFRCSCPYGHTLAGDGRACVAECPAGYRKQPSTPIPGGNLSRKECVDINECEEPEVSVPGHRCQWKCVNLPGSHRCICPRGYKLSSDRHHCRDINECSRKNGGCSHLCLNHKGSYQCSCPASHRLSPYSRKKCQPRKEQQSNV